jgi:hypothetical protein
VGAPVAKLSFTADMDWRLVVQNSDQVMGEGKASFSDSNVVGLYRGQGLPWGNRMLHQRCLPAFVGQIVEGVESALAEQTPDQWIAEAKKHEQWRLAK